jgi:hypothetical protein
MLLATVKVHESKELPDPETLVSVKEQPVLLLARLTTPANPLRLVSVMVEVAAVPALTVMVVGEAVSVKSCTV